LVTALAALQCLQGKYGTHALKEAVGDLLQRSPRPQTLRVPAA
jgi:hypothetical protein